MSVILIRDRHIVLYSYPFYIKSYSEVDISCNLVSDNRGSWSIYDTRQSSEYSFNSIEGNGSLCKGIATGSSFSYLLAGCSLLLAVEDFFTWFLSYLFIYTGFACEKYFCNFVQAIFYYFIGSFNKSYLVSLFKWKFSSTYFYW